MSEDYGARIGRLSHEAATWRRKYREAQQMCASERMRRIQAENRADALSVALRRLAEQCDGDGAQMV
ncbi:hypothetical protein [Pseudoscardovia radai]|uniref:hypothetical protein n=1 Tax=Pseudoscardovia radai TaxID=987066 RepID=UPI003995846B